MMIVGKNKLSYLGNLMGWTDLKNDEIPLDL